MASIRTIFLAGFLGGNVSGLIYMAVRGVLLEACGLNPLAMIGGFLAVGTIGMACGAMGGLSLRMALEKTGQIVGRDWMPVLVSALISAAVGLFVVAALVSFES